MDGLDRIRLLAELEDDFCELNHGPYTKREDYQAANYLVVPVGYKKNKVEEVACRELVIPVCQDCFQSLLQDEWTLLFCLDCCVSRWICRAFSRNRYRHHILWLKGCPDCSNTFEGLYFTDQQMIMKSSCWVNGKHYAMEA